MDLIVSHNGDHWRAASAGRHWRCAIGRGGIVTDKQEGDGGTPIGCWPLRRVLYRPDRLARPATNLPITALTPEDGWCDDPQDPRYNQQVLLPFNASHEVLWRADRIYDIIVILGHNDDPPVPGQGSAIFLHIAKENYAPTLGCVALALPDLVLFLNDAGTADRVCIDANAGR